MTNNNNMIGLVGKGLTLLDGSNLYYMNDDIFLIHKNGKIELLLDFKLLRTKKGHQVKVKKAVLVDVGI